MTDERAALLLELLEEYDRDYPTEGEQPNLQEIIEDLKEST